VVRCAGLKRTLQREKYCDSRLKAISGCDSVGAPQAGSVVAAWLALAMRLLKAIQ
jgi:hypothetical protein